MRIIISLILLFATSVFTTPSYDEYIATNSGNIVRSASDSGIVICNKDMSTYFVTKIESNSYSFYPNYILGKNSKGFFAFNENTMAVEYFKNTEKLNEFKKANDLWFSFAEKRQMLQNSLLITFFASIVIFFLIVFWKFGKIEITTLKSRFLIYYLVIIFLTKIFNIAFAYFFLYDPKLFYSPESVYLILLYSALFWAPWLITFWELSKITTKIGQEWNSVLFLIMLSLDFLVVSCLFYIAEESAIYLILYIIFCNFLLLTLYGISLLIRKIVIKNIEKSNSRKLELGRNKRE